jgi:two-component system, sensor histidine kinase and response regulator
MIARQAILIVEDDDDLRRLFRTTLTLAGYAVFEADNGLDALRRIDHSPPDLVVLDLMLPTISGFAVQQEISAQSYTSHIPIIVITGSAIELTGVNVACVLRKPIEPDELLAAVRNCLAKAVPDTSV